MSVISNLRGTIEALFQVGKDGPNLKNSSGVLEARNAGDSAYSVVRGAAPVGDDDLVTSSHLDGQTWIGGQTLFSDYLVSGFSIATGASAPDLAFENDACLVQVDLHYEIGRLGTAERNRPFTGF